MSDAAPAGVAPGAWTGARVGFAMGARRLAHRATALTALLGAALAVTGALIERRVTVAGSVDRALGGAFGLVVPLVVFAITGRAIGRARLGEACFRAARFGLRRRDVALGLLAATALGAAGVAVLVGLAALLAAHGEGSPPLLADALATTWIAALTGCAYAGWFSFGATFLAFGRGRWIPFALDFALGGAGGALALGLPRAHALQLLGLGGATTSLLVWNAMALVAMAIVLPAAAALRCGD